jgi:hypothetical protein
LAGRNHGARLRTDAAIFAAHAKIYRVRTRFTVEHGVGRAHEGPQDKAKRAEHHTDNPYDNADHKSDDRADQGDDEFQEFLEGTNPLPALAFLFEPLPHLRDEEIPDRAE